MPIYYPQGIMTMRVRPENFGRLDDAKLNDMYVFSVVCKQLTVNLNSYLEADTFDATIDFKNFPFDPRTIRAVGVTIHVEDREKLFRTNNSLNLLKPDDKSTIFIGFADSDNISLSEEERTVRLEGRDFTSLLIDQEYIGDPIIPSKPLDQVIRGLLDQLDAAKDIKIDNQVGDLPILAGFGSDKEASSGAKNGRKKRSYWDQIQALVEKAGLIAFISLDKLVITKPRQLYDRKKSKLFVYGQNVKDLNFERKLGRQKGFNVRVLSLNMEKKEVLEAKIPAEATADWAQDIGIKRSDIKIPTIKSDGTKGEDKTAPFITFRIRDVVNKDKLVSIGEKIFEEVGRQQIEGSLSTKEMRICDDKNNFFDATQFRVGTPIEVSIEQGDLEGFPDLQNIPNPATRKNKIKQFLIRNCYSQKVADALAETLVRFDTPFFTKSVEFRLDQENGWEMELDFINFIELPRSLSRATA